MVDACLVGSWFSTLRDLMFRLAVLSMAVWFHDIHGVTMAF